MFQKFNNNIRTNLINFKGWNTKRKIVVFESDDWGMIRMASKEAYNRLLVKGYPVDKCVYNRNDALETNEDVLSLMEVLSLVKDSEGNPAKFTLNNIVGNPDFNKIKESNFEHYYYEPFYKTLQRYKNTSKVMDLYKEGINNNIFQMQFHGREHVNLNRWMGALQDKNKILLDAFNEQMFTVASENSTSGRRDYLDSFGNAYRKEFESMQSIIESGTILFKDIWGFNSDSFIAPCYVWSQQIESILAQNGVKFIQGTHVQKEPKPGLNLEFTKTLHYQGQKGANSICYLVRNAYFEPVTVREADKVVADTMRQIKNAFVWKKPAIISSHRVNYMSSLRLENRDNNLKRLKLLLESIIKKWPDVQFMSSDQLGALISKEI